MNKLKTALVLLFLLILTSATVLLPIIFNTDSSSRLTEESSTYTRKNSEITAKQVAKLYSSGEISSSIVLSGTESFSPSEVRKSTNLVLDFVFSENETANSYISRITDGNITYYHKESMLVINENTPVALNIINIVYTFEDESLELTFEEKTKTLLHFSYSCESNSDTFPNEIIETLACDYYKNSLSISEGNFYFENYIAKGNLFVFGIVQSFDEKDYPVEIQ